jgi:transcriptional regulator with GAF, ATPase, and Fis domain
MEDTRKTAPAEELLRAPAAGVVVLSCPEARLAGGAREIGDGITVGRAGGPGLDLAIDDPEMSRRHARITAVGLDATVEDLGSTNGTFVNGERVTRARAAAGDIVRTGGTLFEVVDLSSDAGEEIELGPELVGRSAAFRAAVRAVDRAARAALPVLLAGETGTGKELLAARLHARSGRQGAFVALNSAAIPRELLESTMFGHRRGGFTGAEKDAVGQFARAHRGTLFLDEVGELPQELQPKLLRALETGEFLPVGATAPETSDVRLVAATNADLAGKMEAGTFRRDLYARLSGYVVELPPLRLRRGDIAVLAQHFLPDRRLTAGFLEPLLLAPWPMNVRELRSVCLRVALLAEGHDALTVAHAQAALGAMNAPLAQRLARPAPAEPPPEPDEPEGPAAEPPPREELEALLGRHAGNVQKLARHYGKHRKQIYRWLARHALDPDRFRGG